jgi:uncharacterized repeat protein (TIGR01451 family)
VGGSAAAINDGTDTLGYRFSPDDLPALADIPLLSLSLDPSSSSLLAGDEVTYALTLKVTGSAAAAGAAPVVHLPAGAQVVRFSSTAAVSGGDVAFAPADLPAGGARVETVTVTYPAAGVQTASADATAANGGAAHADSSIVVTPRPSLDLTVAAPPTAAGFNEVTASLTVRTTSVVPVAGVTVSAALPPAGHFVRSTPGCQLAGSTLTCPVGDLGPNQSRTITAVQTYSQSGTAVVTGHASSTSGAGADGSASTVILGIPGLTLAADGPARVVVGDQASYHIHVGNTGGDPGDAVILDVPVPPAASFVSAGPPCSLTAAVVSCAFGTVTPGQSHDATVVFSWALSGDRAVTATINSANGLPLQAVVPTSVVRAAVLDVRLFGPVRSLLDDVITTTLSVRDAGFDPVHHVTVTDALPAGIAVESLPSACQPAPSAVVCAVGDLAPNGVALFPMSLRYVTRGAQDQTATATADDLHHRRRRPGHRPRHRRPRHQHAAGRSPLRAQHLPLRSQHGGVQRGRRVGRGPGARDLHRHL